MTWKPLQKATGENAFRKKLSEIADIMAEKVGEPAPEKDSEQPEALNLNVGVMGGKAGVAIFFFYYAQMTMEPKYMDIAHQLLSDIFDNLGEDSNVIHTLAGGLAGVGWMVELLEQNDFIEADTGEMLEALDEPLYNVMMADIKSGNYDFLHGAVGTGTYFLSRLNKIEKASDYLLELIEEMDKSHYDNGNGGIAWESVLDREKNTRGYNLSLSHGLASIIVFLSKCLDKGLGEKSDRIAYLLKGAVTYTISQQLDWKENEEINSVFPSWVGKDYPPAPSRLAWCYGDLGMGIALYQASQSMNNKEWEEAALETLTHASKRRDLQKNALVDAGMCHGAAGIAHIFNRIYQHTGDENFKETALYWLEVTLKMATHEDGFAGFKAWHTEKYGGWVAEVGFLEGVAGIGLALIAALSEQNPAWDHCLYLS